MSSSIGSIAESLRSASGGGYSSVVQLFVLINGEKFDVGQVGGGKLYFDKPVLLPAGHATLVIELDGQAKEKSIEIVAEPVATRIVQFK